MKKRLKIGLRTVIHKARFEELENKPQIIFDGGHNENAIKNLKEIINDYYKNNKKIYIISILKSKDYKTIIKLLTQDKNSIFIFTSGNDEKRYISKEELFNEAKKYLEKNIYMSDLEKAVVEVRKRCKEEIIIIARKFLYIWKCIKSFGQGEIKY